MNELTDLIYYLIDNHDVCQKIGTQGKILAKHHLPEKRLEQILNLIKNEIKKKYMF